MGMYEFDCIKCKKSTERILKYKEVSSQTCDKCGSKLIKKISRFRVKFGESFIRNFIDETPTDPGAPYKGFHYDDEYVERQDEKAESMA